jgi:hypothetical protein
MLNDRSTMLSDSIHVNEIAVMTLTPGVPPDRYPAAFGLIACRSAFAPI